MELISLLIAFVCFFVTFLANLILKRKQRFKIFEKYGIPGPKPSFWTGNLSQMKKTTGTKNDVLSAWIKEYGNVVGYFAGGMPFIVIKDLDLLKQICLRDIHVFHDRAPEPIIYHLLDKGVGYIRGERWRNMRRILSPSFSRAKVKLMTGLISKKVDCTVSLIAEKAENNEMFDIYPITQCLSLDVIAECIFSINTDSQSNPQEKLKIAVNDFIGLNANRTKMLAVLFPSLTRVMSFVDKHWMASGRAINVLMRKAQKVILERKKNQQFARMDILQFLMDNGDDGIKSSSKLTHEEILANAYGLIIGGYETTSTALAFTFYLLIKHPEIQERLYNDIKSTEDDSFESIQGLRYLDQVFNESLRLYPPAPGVVSRFCATDHEVCSSLTIPKGVTVEVPVWDIHHDPDLWPDPWTFNPDRFSPDNKASLNSTANMAFGLGARNCIGRRFALLEAKLAIFKLLKRFKFEMCEKTDDPLKMECSRSVNHPKNGMFLRAVKREEGI